MPPIAPVIFPTMNEVTLAAAANNIYIYIYMYLFIKYIYYI